MRSKEGHDAENVDALEEGTVINISDTTKTHSLELVGSKPPLNWDMFVTPVIPVAITNDIHPGQKRRMFSPISSTFIYDKKDVVLVDANITFKQADALADWIAARGKNLTTIYITHDHGDHWFGMGSLLERFPNARAVATPDVVRVMRQHTSPEILERVWKTGFPGQIPDSLPKSSKET